MSLKLWYTTRILFYVSLITLFLTIILMAYDYDLELWLVPWIIFLLLLIPNIILSCIHLFKYKDKTLAIISLVLNLFYTMIIFFSMFLSFLVQISTNNYILNETNPELECQYFCLYEAENSSYYSYDEIFSNCECFDENTNLISEGTFY